MLDTVNRIRTIIDKTHPRGHLPYKVSGIIDAVWQVTNIDKVQFNGFYDPDCSNPIWGRFRRFEQAQLGPYAGQGCVIEIDYNRSLEAKPHFLRYVVTKELCHALERDASVRVNSFPDVERLIKALQSHHTSEAGAIFRPFLSEKIAEICALELLCPCRDRRKIIARRAAGEDLSDMAIARAFWIPVEHIPYLFDPDLISLVESAIGNGQ